MKNVAISFWWSLKPVSITLLLSKESGLFVKTKPVLDLCVFVIQVDFFIKFAVTDVRYFARSTFPRSLGNTNFVNGDRIPLLGLNELDEVLRENYSRKFKPKV